ncbi:MAG: VOC family protein [Gammaproteobacteria bacterium]|nr:VOC family protein [Gammaproteobacteria bacterium]
MATIQALAYVVAESTDPSKWKQFGEQVLGAATSSAPDGGMYLKMDERAFRIAVVKGAQDRYFASGWEVADATAFAETVAAIKQAGVAVEPGSPALRQARGVQDIATFSDPSGNRHELVWGYNGPKSPFVSPIGVSGFKTGALGAGHTVLPAMQSDATLKFFRETLGFGLSDIFDFRPAPNAPAMRIRFLYTPNGRHHSLALAEMPSPSGCVHIMVEVDSMTEVGLAHDRMQKHGIKLMATLGQHENDRMTSFYMLTPGNFALEYGWGGLVLDTKTHQTTQTKQVSIWGHDFSVGFR